MVKNLSTIVLICYSNSFASNLVGNVNDTKNINTLSNKYNSTTYLVKINYTAFNYSMQPKKMSEFIKANSLKRINLFPNNQEIKYAYSLDTITFNNLERQFQKIFTSQSVVNTTCNTNSCKCGGANTSHTYNQQIQKYLVANNHITFKLTQTTKNNFNAQINYFYSTNIDSETTNLTKINFSISLTQALSKKYIIISQNKKNNIVFGQIMFISFQ